ncbi:MAG: protein of unknown function DUF755 [Anelloviridae sp.]|nr:MAG: protein of unknown function DUF755 [Anelloviridae sp.]
MKDEANLLKKLQKESRNTKKLKNLFSQLQNQLLPVQQHRPFKKHRHQKHRTRKTKKRRSRSSSSSSESSKNSSEGEYSSYSTD